MQTLTWYMARLLTMSPQEVSWRVRTSARNQLDYVAAPLRRRRRRSQAFLTPGIQHLTPPFHTSHLDVGAWAAPSATPVERIWCRRLVARADRIAANRLSFFDLPDCDLGHPLDWNRDPKSGRAAPLRFAPLVDYRDFRVTGDCKFVWEPNRHHQLTVLARAYRASGDRCYASAAVSQLQSWLDQCPYGLGMNWRSPLELAIRLINWIWTMDLIRDAGVINADFQARWLQTCYQHVWEIARNYSRGSSAGNHRVGEAAGVYIATSYLLGLKHARKWRLESHALLEEEILKQTYPDGGPREQALGYHFFILQFFLLAGLVARWNEEDFSDAYWARLQRMFAFIAGLQAGGDTVPMFGDCDDGYVLDLGNGPPDAPALLSLGAALFPDRDWAGAWLRDTQPARWLELREMAGETPASPCKKERLRENAIALALPAPIHSHAFEDTGYYLLQSGAGEPDSLISVVFDCGPLGLAPLAGHGHADALSFTLRALGRDILVDPGTYDYFTYPAWRQYFRSTYAHNTIVVDGHDQSDMRGPFLWGRPSQARCLAWEPTATGGTVGGEHDGYTRLRQPVVHRRTVTLDGDRREIVIRDDLVGKGQHDASVNFHFAEHCRVSRKQAGLFDVDAGPGRVSVELDPRLAVQELKGSTEPIGGWVSRGYHHRAPATTLVGRVTWRGNLSLVSRINIGRPQ